LDTILQQLADPFRIGMIFFLLLTALRTRAAMGMVIPLALGVVFIAAIIPITLQAQTDMTTEARITTIAYGIVSNAIILAVCLAGWSVLQKLRG